MGVFDTFYGEVQCPHCNKIHEFYEQTKAYDCVMENLLIGDYIDKGNRNYIYEFDSHCEEHGQLFQIGIVVRRGQIVKFVTDEEIKSIDIQTLDNIEDGLGQRLKYEKNRREANGFPFERLEYGKNPLPVGFKFIAFEVEWEVIEICKQKEDWIGLGTEYYYKIKSKEHGLRIMKSSQNMWGRVNIVSLEVANQYRSQFYDD